MIECCYQLDYFKKIINLKMDEVILNSKNKNEALNEL